MAWSVKVTHEFERDILSNLVDEVVARLEEEEISPEDEVALDEVLYDIVIEVAESSLIYKWDLLAVIQYYGHLDDGLDGAWDDLYSDVCNRARERYVDGYGEID